MRQVIMLAVLSAVAWGCGPSEEEKQATRQRKKEAQEQEQRIAERKRQDIPEARRKAAAKAAAEAAAEAQRRAEEGPPLPSRWSGRSIFKVPALWWYNALPNDRLALACAWVKYKKSGISPSLAKRWAGLTTKKIGEKYAACAYQLWTRNRSKWQRMRRSERPTRGSDLFILCGRKFGDLH